MLHVTYLNERYIYFKTNTFTIILLQKQEVGVIYNEEINLNILVR